jgi:hypothetical protein
MFRNTGSNDDLLWPAAGPVCFASSLCFLIGSLAAIEIAPPALGPLLFGLAIWLPSGLFALWQKQYWWVVASLAPILPPIIIYGAIFASCYQGDCL